MSIWRRSYTLPLAGIVLTVVVFVLGRGALPALVQRLQVEPAEVSQERPYITHNIAFTRRAFGLEGMIEQSFPAQEAVRADYPAQISFSAFGEVLARRENRVFLDPEVKDAYGIPALRFDYRFGDNDLRMAEDMADQAEAMLRASGAEDIRVTRAPLPEGWSIHELGTARMGTDPDASVTNAFGQAHDVRNLFIADGSVFVSAGCQNPTWTILALCWRSMDYLKEQMRAGNV